jgi:hypothetical protein
MIEMTSTTLSKSELKLENARIRQEQTTAEREDARRLEAERTARLRALRLARDAAQETETMRPGAEK